MDMHFYFAFCRSFRFKMQETLPTRGKAVGGFRSMDSLVFLPD